MPERDFSTRWLRAHRAHPQRFFKCLTRARRRRELLRTLQERREQQNQTQTRRRGDGHVAVFRRASGEHGGRREGLDSPAICRESRVRGAVSPRSVGPERRRADRRRS
jgi:hypothetical protein